MRFFVFLFLLLLPVPVAYAVPVSLQKSPGIAEKTAIRSPRAVIELSDRIRSHFEQTTSGSSGRKESSFGNQLERWYASRGYQPFWTKPAMVNELIAAIDEAAADGLVPDDYHVLEIKSLAAAHPRNPELQAQYEMLLSNALLSLATHLRFGKVDPCSLDPDWNIGGSDRRSAFEFRVQGALSSGTIRELLSSLRPKHPKYLQLKKSLARYRSIAGAGGWQRIPEGTSFREGLRDRRVPLLRKRLQESGDLSGNSLADTSMVYGPAMKDAVKRYQKRNGLEVDGVAGAETLRELNLTAGERVNQIRINLERYRWFISDLDPTHLLVNIAGFTLEYVENVRSRWRTRVIVGQPGRQTPVFKADMQYVVFNPQWVIPPTILANDALPAIQRSRSYLDRKRLKVIDSKGNEVNPAFIDWSAFSASNFPYRLQQSSGDNGALGRIKFMMPNKHVIYLHDTPAKDLFGKSARAFSSGCIRVENPLDLAELVLQDTVRWSRRNIEAALATKKTSTVNLNRRIPVFLIYLTVETEGDDLLFRKDIYGRDSMLLKALDAPAAQHKTGSCG